MKSALFFFVLVVVAVNFIGCDIVKPKKKFRLATCEHDYFYHRMASHLKPFLESKGFEIDLVQADNSIEANAMVARGEADITFVNNHSHAISKELGTESGMLRTVIPLATRLFLAFSRTALPANTSARELFRNKKVGIELLNGEAQMNIERFFNRAKISEVQLVTFQDNPDVVIFWGTLYGQRAAKYLADDWHPFSFNDDWIEFLTLNESALRPFTLPAVPGDDKAIRVNTIATEAVLVASQNLGENALYE